jgi:quercetin dioxygenase-like cupin family protein
MKVIAASLLASAAAVVLAANVAPAKPETPITIMRAGSTAPIAAAPENFEGEARVAWRFQREAPARVTGALVTFEAGARTAWHSHPLGQTLIVTEGSGFIQQRGGPIQEFREGDVVWTPPNVQHWHGASKGGRMSHIAIQERIDGSNVQWFEKVARDES